MYNSKCGVVCVCVQCGVFLRAVQREVCVCVYDNNKRMIGTCVLCRREETVSSTGV